MGGGGWDTCENNKRKTCKNEFIEMKRKKKIIQAFK